MRALMKTNYQLHCRRDLAAAFERGPMFIGYSTR
jgi:hypothetical protein